MTAHETIEMIRNADFDGMTDEQLHEFMRVVCPEAARHHKDTGLLFLDRERLVEAKQTLLEYEGDNAFCQEFIELKPFI